MSHAPRNPEEPIINKPKWTSISVYAAVMAVSTMTAVLVHHYYVHPEDAWDPRSSNNILFLSLIGAQLIHVFNMNEGRRFFSGEEFRNKYIWWALGINGVIMYLAYSLTPMTEALYLAPLQLQDVLIVAGAMVFSFLMNRILKTIGWLK